MLSYTLLPGHRGIRLIADYATLRELHAVLHDVNEHSPLIADRDSGVFLSLAYEVRKAYEQQRATLHPPRGKEAEGVRFGTDLAWPLLLLQQRLLRCSLAYIPHGPRHQAITYALEAAIEAALTEAFGAGAVAAWRRIDAAYPAAQTRIGPRASVFDGWTKAQRKRHFVELLDSLDWSFERIFAASAAQGRPLALAPSMFEAG